jgi:hypothetical protein
LRLKVSRTLAIGWRRGQRRRGVSGSNCSHDLGFQSMILRGGLGGRGEWTRPPKVREGPPPSRAERATPQTLTRPGSPHTPKPCQVQWAQGNAQPAEWPPNSTPRDHTPRGFSPPDLALGCVTGEVSIPQPYPTTLVPPALSWPAVPKWLLSVLVSVGERLWLSLRGGRFEAHGRLEHGWWTSCCDGRGMCMMLCRVPPRPERGVFLLGC